MAKITVHPKLAAEITAQLPLKGDELKSLLKVVEMKANGTGWKDIKRQFNINHIKLDAAWYLNQLLIEGKVEREQFAKQSEAVQQRRCAELRAEGLSWGIIRLMVGVSEGKARDLASKATGIASEGTRVKRGGRFLKEVGEAGYKGNHKGFGVEAAPGTHRQVLPKLKEDDTSTYAAKARAAKRVRTQKPKVKAVA